MTDKIAIIGFGNIASAIVTPLLDNKLIQPENVFCVVNTEKSLENIKKNYKHNINVYKSGSKESKIIWDCQYKLLSIKPQQLNDISEAHHIKNKDNLIVSILAGVSINRLTQKFPNHKCVRVVTNIPITIGKGLTGISWGEEITEDQKQFTKKLFENTSKIYEFTEDYLDIFLALTSSGPATICLIKENKLTTSELKNLVTSPGGTTISALRVLEKKSVRSALIESIVSASNRSKEFR